MNAAPNNGLMAAPAWADRRTDHERRQAITWLRLCEFHAAEHLPAHLMRDLTAAIDGVVDLLRSTPEAPA